MVSPSAKRRAVKISQEEGWGNQAQACRALGLARSSYYRVGQVSMESHRIRREVQELSGRHPRYGYRRITALLRREGFEVNAKRVARIRREEGLKVSKKQRRTRQVWSWDFVADQTENGSSFRILTLIDEYTRECLATHAQRGRSGRWMSSRCWRPPWPATERRSTSAATMDRSSLLMRSKIGCKRPPPRPFILHQAALGNRSEAEKASRRLPTG